jgi:UDP-N-acetylmuramate dehydrogenase
MEIPYRENVPLRTYTTLKTGGVARYVVSVTSAEEVETAVRFAQQNELPFLVIGGGSNLLVSDHGFSGVVIKMEIKGIECVENDDGTVTFICGAGEVFDEVIAESVKRGYSGLENLSAIPGTVGATPVQNVGAYGVDVEDRIVSVEVYDAQAHETRVLTSSECHFGYRDSIFKSEAGEGLIITKVTFRLAKELRPELSYGDLQRYFVDRPAPTHREIRDAIIAIRAEKFPDWGVVGTAGSFFKNPIVPRADALALRAKYIDLPIYDVDEKHMKVSLGYILDKVCHLKGYRRGPISLYDKQAMVLVNDGEGTTSDILSFAFMVMKYVEDETGLHIEREVRYIE